MPEFAGLAFGLLTALFWGMTDFAAKRSVEEVDSLSVTFSMEIVGALFLGSVAGIGYLVAPATLEFWMPAEGAPVLYWWNLSMLVGVSAIVGVMFAFRAYSKAPLAVASPIVNTKGMFASLLAITLLGEEPYLAMVAGALCCAVGAVMIGYEKPEDARRHGTRFLQPGVGSALISAAGYGVAMCFTQPVVRYGGYGMGIFGLRAGAMLLLFPVALWQLGWKNLIPPRKYWGKVVQVGIYDSFGHMFVLLGYGFGSSVMVSSVASLAPAFTLLLALLVLKEHLVKRQWIALGFVAVGIVLLSV